MAGTNILPPALTKGKTGKVLKVAAAIALPVLVSGGIWFVMIRKTKKGTTLWNQWTKGSTNNGGQATVQSGQSAQTITAPPVTTPKSTPAIKYNPATNTGANSSSSSSISGFPLAIGSSGQTVMKLQAALNQMNIVDPLVIDGKFGPLTKASVLAADYNYPVSEADYNRIIS